MTTLRDIAPRIGLARDQWVREAWLERRRLAKLASLILSAERLVAHRELRLVRAFNTRNSRYIRVRQDKLASAEHELKRLRGRR